jgi:hypothetical protein
MTRHGGGGGVEERREPVQQNEIEIVDAKYKY